MTTPSSTSDPNRQIRPDLIERIIAYKAEHSVSDETLGKLCGSNASQINRAINKKFQGDATAFEAKLDDFFKAEPRRRAAKAALVPNAFTRAVADFLDTVRRTGDIGLGFSVAGMGKTSGIELYAAANPTAVSIRLSKWCCGSTGVCTKLFQTIENRGWKHDISRGDFLVDRFAGSRRLIIIDNAHRMSRTAREWVFDFHDDTDCPIALIGNPELLDEIRKNDQQFSRIGLKRDLKTGHTNPAILAAINDACATQVLLHWPEADGQLGDLPQQVATQKGRVRALKKQLLLARDLAPGFPNPAEAFRAAHTQLVRDYALV